MKHRYLEQYGELSSAHWAANTNGGGEVLLQLCDDTDTEVRLKLTPDQAKEVALELRKLSEKARTEPTSEQARLIERFKEMGAVPVERPASKPAPKADQVGYDFKAATATETFFPILGCLQAAEKYLKGIGRVGKVDWQTTNKLQEVFRDIFLPHLSEVDLLGVNLKYRADVCAAVINQWFKEHGFDIKLDEGPPGSFCVGSILDVLVNWIEKGVKTEVDSPVTGKTYPAVEIKSGMSVFEDASAHPWPIVQLVTREGDKVYLTVAGNLPEWKFETCFPIASRISDLSNKVIRGMPSGKYGKVVFPMVDYDDKIDLSWILNMRTGNTTNDFYIHKAVQQTQFRMNEIGARARSAVGMQMRCMCAINQRPTLLIDRPFLLWIERTGINIPLFTGVFAEDVWKRPKGL